MSWGVNSSFARTNQYYPKTMLTGYEANSKAYTKELRKNDYLLDATLTYTKRFVQGTYFESNGRLCLSEIYRRIY